MIADLSLAVLLFVVAVELAVLLLLVVGAGVLLVLCLRRFDGMINLLYRHMVYASSMRSNLAVFATEAKKSFKESYQLLRSLDGVVSRYLKSRR